MIAFLPSVYVFFVQLYSVEARKYKKEISMYEKIKSERLKVAREESFQVLKVENIKRYQTIKEMSSWSSSWWSSWPS